MIGRDKSSSVRTSSFQPAPPQVKLCPYREVKTTTSCLRTPLDASSSESVITCCYMTRNPAGLERKALIGSLEPWQHSPEHVREDAFDKIRVSDDQCWLICVLFLERVFELWTAIGYSRKSDRQKHRPYQVFGCGQHQVGRVGWLVT